ncbi:MAG TPA: glycosyltransferase [Flavihumibacter sp.]|nr:glycosyltransferase [Bacteroidota bacterium]HQD08740.1 glycosyltransferase [Flavihumibacter sp.]
MTPSVTVNNPEPLISVVMPAYNAAQYILESIESVLSQSYRHFELLVIDDGSTDNTADIIRSVNDDRIKLVANDQNHGIIFTLNRGIALANGKYIARLDSDDLAMPTRFEKQVRFMEENPKAGACGTYFKVIDKEGKTLQQVKFPSAPRDAKTYLLLHNCFCHSSVMMRTDLAKALKYADEYLVCEDHELWHRISQVTEIANVPEYLTAYRIHGNNISTTKREIMFNSLKMLNRKMLTDIGMIFSEEELTLHSAMLTYQHQVFDGIKLDALDNWIIKLYDFFRKHPALNEKVMIRIAIKRWVVIARQTGHTQRILDNRFFANHPAMFMEELFRKVIWREKVF